MTAQDFIYEIDALFWDWDIDWHSDLDHYIIFNDGRRHYEIFFDGNNATLAFEDFVMVMTFETTLRFIESLII